MLPEYAHLSVRFYMGTRENKRKSAEAGRPIFDDREMVELKIPGDMKNEYHAPAHDPSSYRDKHTGARLTYAELFAEHYAAFKAGIAYKGAGTPLSELPFLTEAKRKELQALNIFTAEQLAGLEGTLLQRLGMGARELKNKAHAWIDNASGSAQVTKLAAENAALQDRLAALEELIKGAKAPPPSPEKEDAEDGPAEEPAADGKSPFADWDDDTIRVWYKEQGGVPLRGNYSHAGLVAKADELNAALKAKVAA